MNVSGFKNAPALKFKIASIDNYKEYFVLEKLDKRILKYADMLISGQLTFGYDSIDPFPYNPLEIKNFNWNFDNKKDSNTFLLYAFGLTHVYILSRAYQKTNEIKYFNLAWEFIVSFHSHIVSKKEKNAFLFNDHAVAERTENLIFFGYVASLTDFNIKEPAIIEELIVDCNNRLFSDKHYQFNQNHGIIVDKALIIGASCLNNDETNKMIDHAISRLQKQVEFAFGTDGVHVENSIDYHFSITNLLRGIQNSLIFIKHPFSEQLGIILNKTLEFMVYAIKPNLQRPLYGDSKGVKGQGPTDFDARNHPNLIYIKSMGKEGLKPSKLNAYFPNSGYVFLREHFEGENYKQATWLSLKAGYKTRTHKHQDDLSICLYSKGYDIFVDAGMYNFMPKNIYKDYMESIPAHSTIGIVDKPYSIARANGEKFTIQTVEHNDIYEYVLASSRVYDGCAIYRHLYYFRKENILIIRDEVFSDQPQHFAQYFHMGLMMKEIIIDPKRSVFQIGDSGFSIVMKQLNPIDSVNLLQGTEIEPMSIISTGFSDFMDTQTIQFCKQTDHFEFITAIEIILNSNAITEYFDQVILDQNKLVINANEIKLNPSIPVEFLGADITCDNLTIIIKNYIRDNLESKFALYIYDHKKRKKIADIPYTSNPTIEYEITQSGEFVLMYYVSNGKNEKIKGIIATLIQKNNKLKITRFFEKLHIPKVEQIKVSKENEKEYRFVIPIQYDFPYQVKWWVYRNGVSLPIEKSNTTNSLIYSFPTSGDYVIMCSVSDIYFGEFYFGQNEVIHID